MPMSSRAGSPNKLWPVSITPNTAGQQIFPLSHRMQHPRNHSAYFFAVWNSTSTNNPCTKGTHDLPTGEGGGLTWRAVSGGTVHTGFRRKPAPLAATVSCKNYALRYRGTLVDMLLPQLAECSPPSRISTYVNTWRSNEGIGNEYNFEVTKHLVIFCWIINCMGEDTIINSDCCYVRYECYGYYKTNKWVNIRSIKSLPSTQHL